MDHPERGFDPPVAAPTTGRRGKPAGFLRHLPMALLLATIGLLLLLARGPFPDRRLDEAGVLVGFAIISWTFGLLPEPITTLSFFLLAVLFAVAKPAVIFSGFASTAWWLVLGGSIIAVAVQTTGLGHRLAGLFFGRAGGSYPKAVAAVAVAAVGLAFVMPSTNARILLLTPIVLAFAERIGLTPERAGYTGLVVTAACASFMPTTAILPANVPNSILLGAADTLYGVKLTYGPYLLLHFPVLGVLKTLVLVWLVCRLFPEREPLLVPPARLSTPLSPPERRLLVLLFLSLVLFATDFLHGISPAWIALGTGILCLLPPLEILSTKALSERINFNALLYIAGILGLGAVVADSGLSRLVSGHLLEILARNHGSPAVAAASVSGIGAGIGALTTLTSVPAVLTPLARQFAAASGLPLLTVLMLEVVVFSTVFLPYESPPIMVGLQLGGVSARAAAKLCLALAAVTIVVLLPLDYLWWRLLGYLP